MYPFLKRNRGLIGILLICSLVFFYVHRNNIYFVTLSEDVRMENTFLKAENKMLKDQLEKCRF